MKTFKNTLGYVAIVASMLLIQAMALEAGVNGGCPKGFYCALKKEGGEWCTGHNECLSGECVVGVGCAMTSNDVSGNGCSVDSDCDDGFQCRSSVCYVPDIPQVVESTTTDEPNNSRTGLSSGAIAGLAVAVVLVLLVIASIALRASKPAVIVEEENDAQDKKQDDGVATEAGSEAGGEEP